VTTEIRFSADDGAGGILKRAEFLLEVDRPRDALLLLLDALRLEPENHRVLARIAAAHLALQDHREALKFANETVRVAPELEWGHRLRSIVLLHIGDKREAYRAAERAAQLDPENLLVLNQLFSVMRASGMRAEAWNVAHRMVNIGPSVSATHINLGLVHLEYKQFVEAEAAFRRALQLEPESWPALNNMGVALQGQGKHQDAVEFFYRAAQLNPSRALPRNNLVLAGKKYLSGPSTVLAVVFVVIIGNIVGLLKLGDNAATVVIWAAIILAVAGVAFDRRRRLRNLGEPVQRIFSDQKRAEQRKSTHRILTGTLIAYTLLFGIMGLFFPFTGGLTGLGGFVIIEGIEAGLILWWWRTRPPRGL